MTEEVEKVTTEKQKNPGRQEWGRKLGKMQKQLKLKKENEEVKESKFKTDESNSFLKWEYALTGATILVGVAALYYQKKRYECQLQKQQIKQPEITKKELRFSAF